MPTMPCRPKSVWSVAYLEAIVLPLILGSTVVLAKLALVDAGPLTLAALRFALAALILLPVVLLRGGAPHWTQSLWLRFTAMGISFYVIGNGSLFLGLKFIPATTAALLLSLTPLVVLALSILWLHEVPSPLQLVAVAVCIGGSLLFFAQGVKSGQPLGIVIVAVGLFGSAWFTVMGRDIAREQLVDTLSLTAMPLALGAAVLLPIALLTEGLPSISLKGWSIVVVLALLNTIGAYLLYSHLLCTFTAFELTAVLNVNPLVSAGLAWIILGNRLSALQLLAMVVVLASVFTVQLGSRHHDIVQEEVPRERPSSREET